MSDLPVWRDELIRLGGSIHQDADPPLNEEEGAAQQAGVERYVEILGVASSALSPAAIEAILWSLHPIDDYGIYESAYGTLSRADPAVFGSVAGQVLPLWLTEHGEHDSMLSALILVPQSEEGRRAFLDSASAWTPTQRTLVVSTTDRWARDDDHWEQIHTALGGTRTSAALAAIPDDWPDDWRDAAIAFRESGRVDRAWTNERDIPSNFPRVFALIELGHGARWREVPGFLNPLFIRRRNELPGLGQALGELPTARRERILTAIRRANPDTASRLDALLKPPTA